MVIDFLLLIALTVCAIGSILKRDMVKAAIALALTSVILSILMFRLSSPLAAAFELSVCAGLITVIFMTTISLTKPLTRTQKEERARDWRNTFPALPILVIAAGTLLAFIKTPTNFILPQVTGGDVRRVLWNTRQLDLIGQILVILVGCFGVLALFKDRLTSTERMAAWSRHALTESAVAVKSSSIEKQRHIEVAGATRRAEPQPKIHSLHQKFGRGSE